MKSYISLTCAVFISTAVLLRESLELLILTRYHKIPVQGLFYFNEVWVYVFRTNSLKMM